MEHMLLRLISEPFMTLALPVTFLLSMILYRRRVKREQSADYRRPSSPHSTGPTSGH